jgi:lipopolysaccharide biosynthesis glycosyltransferase
MDPFGFDCSMNIFLYNETLPTESEDLAFLRSIQPSVPVFFRSFSFEEAFAKSGAVFAAHSPVFQGQFSQRNMGLVRLWIPLLYTADWFMYLDDDFFFRRGKFFPEVMEFTSNSSKVLFAVRDHFYLMARDFQDRIAAYRPKNQTEPTYFGSGFLFMRGGSVLQQELRNTIQYFADHMELGYPDQDALNLGFESSRVVILPDRFCVTDRERKRQWNTAYGFHFNGGAKRIARGTFTHQAISEYRKAKEKWHRDRLGLS